jgi:uncharacterized membrane protein
MNLILLVTHVVLATLAFGFIIFFDFVLVGTAKARDVRAIRTTFPVALRTARWVGLLLGLAIIFGFIEAVRLGYPLLSGWLIFTYVLLAIAGALGIGGTFRRHVRVLHEAFKSPDDRPSPELEKAILDEQPSGAFVMIIAMTAIVYAMFAKPFG